MRTILIIALAGLFLAACSSPTEQATVKNLTAAELKTVLDTHSPSQLIYVRTDEEVRNGVIANARQIDIQGADFGEQIDRLDKTKPVYVYCAVGGRSAQAAQIMRQKGFKEVYNLEGGIQEWLQAGYQVHPIN